MEIGTKVSENISDDYKKDLGEIRTKSHYETLFGCQCIN